MTANLHFRFLQLNPSFVLESPRAAHSAISLSLFPILTFIPSLPHLEDLIIAGLRVSTTNDDNTIFRPSASPPLTGTLSISRSYRMTNLFVWLLDLPNGIRFQKFKFLWRVETDAQFVTALIEACSETLEHVDLGPQVKGKLCFFLAFAMGFAPDLNTRPNQRVRTRFRSTSPRRRN